MLHSTLQAISDQLPGVCADLKLDARFWLKYARIVEGTVSMPALSSNPRGITATVNVVHVHLGCNRLDGSKEYRLTYNASGQLIQTESAKWDGVRYTHQTIESIRRMNHRATRSA